MKSLIINFIKNNSKDKRFLITIGICVFIIIFFVIKVYDNFLLEKETDSLLLNVGEEIDSNVEDDNSENKIEEEKTNEIKDVKTEEEEKASEEVQINEENDNSNDICIYITGEVNNIGVYYLKEGSRIIDAINLAGGTTNNANISKINLAFILEDGMKITIPNDNDLKKNPNFEFITRSSGDGANDENIDTNEKNTSSEETKKIDIVNINTASQTELETIPGIGPSLALKIIEYRKENGGFNTIEDIKNVSGIGESRFNDMKNYIKVK